MAEAIHCPSCTTRYRLRPERLKPATRRAKCFSCGSVFPVGDVVQRLLALPAPAATAAFASEAVETAQHRDLAATDRAATTSPSLAIGGLGSAEAGSQEHTLITTPSFLPETKAEPAHAYPPEITETTLSGYTSARDAIEKLFGTAPAASTGLKINQEHQPMDMEATMSALEHTLGGSPAAPATVAREALEDGPTASGVPAKELPGHASATLRLSQEDLLAAIAYNPASPSAPAEPTQALQAADLPAPPTEDRTQVPASTPAPRTFAPLPDAPDTGAEMLRLKIGEDIYGSLTMPQLIAWVEEGRILENHLVARQHSENWLEAQKVPGLRPVFDRMRRERTGSAPNLSSGLAEAAPKKSLFGGLFGKN